ncbi:probable carboxylesterase 2 [Panicum virgatum]|uniref:probable carboxylesterase 2 n=1 Tax=Panicum virgatum TaxID=38727 RepID=UPI0019D51B03|nr:probable carboxylesterase 2 [Panicum virgatum]
MGDEEEKELEDEKIMKWEEGERKAREEIRKAQEETRKAELDKTQGEIRKAELDKCPLCSCVGQALLGYIKIVYPYTESAFSEQFHRYADSLSARAGALVVSVEYRLAPEHPIPAAYEDAWVALQWAATLSDPWLAFHAHPTRMFLASESAGVNIAHSMRVSPPMVRTSASRRRRGTYAWGMAALVFADGEDIRIEGMDALWPFLTAGADGNDDPRISPPAEQVASLLCRRMLVGVAAKDVVRDRSESRREVTLLESKGKDHGFHLYRPGCASAVAIMDRVAEFISGWAPSVIADAETEHLHALETTGRIC